MRYLTDRRAAMRDDPRHLLPSARSVICVGKLYNAPQPYSTASTTPNWPGSRATPGATIITTCCAAVWSGWTRVLRERAGADFESRICVDTAPLLERSYARLAGLGWIGKNTCLINQQRGSWFFLGELLVSLEIAPDAPPPDRCGTCRRCIDACPTAAIVPFGGRYAVDSRLCISYFTIELRGGDPRRAPRRAWAATSSAAISARTSAPGTAARRSPADPAFQPRHFAPPLEQAGGPQRRGIPRSCSAARRSRAPATRASCATSPSPWATARLPQIPRPARKAGSFRGPAGRRARPLGAGKAGRGATVITSAKEVLTISIESMKRTHMFLACGAGWHPAGRLAVGPRGGYQPPPACPELPH